MRSHRPNVRPVPVPDWVLHRPTCSCGWTGDTVRTRALADDQVHEHLTEHHHQEAEQPALPGL
ncbi:MULTISPECIES: hypothetical protein [unclassified Nocardiopsis]|uniref:hypothetical protein n=1 Tax=unclassified Nocardiopsis TaxID=2649073 RepID=UPI0013002AE0|nr:hypothetical protein [Nocardiopsis sp. TNDT3]